MCRERQKILIVDDRRESLIALRKVLSQLDVEIVEAADGNEALAATLDNRFALAILDVMMPGMDGYELAGILRGDPRTRRLPIIFLTAFSSDEDRIFKGYEVGAVDYIVKPYNPNVLLFKVGVFLELERVRAELAHYREHLEHLVADRVREQTCLYAVSRLVTLESDNVGAMLHQIALKIPDGLRGPTAVVARVVLDEDVAVSGPFPDSPWRMSTDIVVSGRKRGLVEVVYSDRYDWGENGEPFDSEEYELIAAIAQMLGQAVARSEAQKALQLTQFTIDSAADAVFWIGPDGRFVYANEAACSSLGYERAELLAMSVFDVEPHLSEGSWPTRWQELRAHGSTTLESEHRCKNGSVFPVEVSLSYCSFSGQEYVCGFARNITERMVSEGRQKLAMSVLKALNRPLYGELPVREILQLIQGFTGVDAVGIRIKDREDYPYFEVSGFSEEFVRTERTLCAYDADGQVLRDDAGDAILECICGNIIQGRFDTTLPFFTRRGSFWTNSTTRLLASTASEELAAKLRNRCNREGYESVALVPLRSGNEVIGLLQLNDRREGMFTEEMIHFFEDITAGIGIAVERQQRETARVQLEAHLRQSQKMETVGQLAGGVAHDFNNLLTAIVGYAEMVEASLDSENPACEDVSEILRAADSASTLTRQLLAFSRKQVIAPVVMDVNSTVKSSLRMLDRLIGEDMELSFQPGRGLWKTLADPSQVEQVLVNLALNARDSMPDGGHMTIETGNVEIRQGRCQACGEGFSGDCVLLSVSDTGRGMDRDTAARVFEPFFTTRQHEGGTGLGLATVHGIIHQHLGHINVYSEPGQGTAFKVYLRRAEGEVPDRPKPRGESVKGGPETILVAEDSVPVRRLTVRVLREAGYTVLEADCGAVACQLSRNHSGAIDLLLTDVVMPDMNGTRLSWTMSDTRSGIRILFMSGHTEDTISRRGILEPDTAFLHKPFTPDVLLREVRGVLDAPASSAGPPRQRFLDRCEVEVLAAAARQVGQLSRELRAEMTECAEAGDVVRLRLLVESAVSPGHSELAELLEQLVDEYAYPDIADVLNREVDDGS